MRGGMGGFRLLLRLASAAVLAAVIGGERLASPRWSVETRCRCFGWTHYNIRQGYQRITVY